MHHVSVEFCIAITGVAVAACHLACGRPEEVYMKV